MYDEWAESLLGKTKSPSSKFVNKYPLAVEYIATAYFFGFLFYPSMPASNAETYSRRQAAVLGIYWTSIYRRDYTFIQKWLFKSFPAEWKSFLQELRLKQDSVTQIIGDFDFRRF